jgi:hypothetical protein
MGICWLYFMSEVIALLLIHLLILSSVFIPNVMAFMSELSKNDVVGLNNAYGFCGNSNNHKHSAAPPPPIKKPSPYNI